MKGNKFFSIVLLLAILFTQAQNRSFLPLLGSNQDVTKSAFCKQYKCQKIPQENGSGYFLTLPSDLSWDKIMAFKESKGKTQIQLQFEWRAAVSFKYDTKKQLIHVEFNLQQDFRNNLSIQNDASKMLADAIQYFVGKRLPIARDYEGDYSPDIDDCFADFRADPKGNLDTFGRVMMTGEIILQVDKKKTKYRVVCSRAFDGSTKEKYTPYFWIEIPDLLK